MNSLGNRQRLADIEAHQDRAELIRDYSGYDYNAPLIKPEVPAFSKRLPWIEEFERKNVHLGRRQRADAFDRELSRRNAK